MGAVVCALAEYARWDMQRGAPVETGGHEERASPRAEEAREMSVQSKILEERLNAVETEIQKLQAVLLSRKTDALQADDKATSRSREAARSVDVSNTDTSAVSQRQPPDSPRK